MRTHKTQKRLFGLLAALALCLAALPLQVPAEEPAPARSQAPEDADGTSPYALDPVLPADEAQWGPEDNVDGTVTVTRGPFPAAALTIPDKIGGRPVTAIKGDAFKERNDLRSVTIPDTVASIGSNAFNKCGSLASVTFGKNLREIGSSAFQSCTALTDLDFPASLETVGHRAFAYCSALTTLRVPHRVTDVDKSAFPSPETLTVYGIPGSYIEDFADWKEFIPSMGPGWELGLELEAESRRITVTGGVGESRPLFAASYDENGRFLAVQVLRSDGTAVLDPAADACRLMWADQDAAPRCWTPEISLNP